MYECAIENTTAIIKIVDFRKVNITSDARINSCYTVSDMFSCKNIDTDICVE